MIRTPKSFNGPFITRHFFPDLFKLGALKLINQGRCYDWAFFAHRMFGAQLWATDYHAWVEVNEEDPQRHRWSRRYFDSETPNGVGNFMLLGCNKRNAFPMPWDEHAPRRMEVAEFKAFWDREGGGFKRHWDTMLESNLKRVLGKRYSELTPIFAKPKPAMVIP